MPDDVIRKEGESKPPESELRDQRRKLLQGAAALAAAALGGAVVTEAAEVPGRLAPLGPERAIGARPVLKVNEVTRAVRNIGGVLPAGVVKDASPLLADLERYLQPILDRPGGAVNATEVNAVTDNVSYSG